MLEKASSDDLEFFYKEKRLQAQSISFMALRFRILEFENKVAQNNLEQSFRSELNSALDSNLLIRSWNKFDEIFEDLLLDSFVELFRNSITNKQLSLAQVISNLCLN